MPKLRLIGLTLLALSATAVSHAEEKRYVSDELNTWVRSGPGDNYRLVGTVNAGEEVTLLQTDANTNYGQVKDSTGRTAWIPLKELNSTPSLRTRVPDLENQVKTLTDKLNNIDTTWNQRTADMQQKVAQSDSVIDGLKEENQKLFEIIRQELPFDQLIDEKDFSWVHVSFREGRNRKQVLKL